MKTVVEFFLGDEHTIGDQFWFFGTMSLVTAISLFVLASIK